MLGYRLSTQSIVDLEDNHQPLINLGANRLLAIEYDSRSKYENFKSKPMHDSSLTFLRGKKVHMKHIGTMKETF